MKLLVNYNPEDAQYQPLFAALLKEVGAYGLTTSKTYELGQLLVSAKTANVDAIIIANEATLANLVNATDGEPSLTTWRGSRLNFSIPTFVTLPFSHLHKVPHGEFVVRHDIKKLAHIKRPVMQLKYKLLDTKQDQEQAVRSLASATLISSDIETDTLNRITCISFSALYPNRITKTYVLPIWDFDTPHFLDDSLHVHALSTMKAILENSVPKIFFNGLYDVQLLLGYRIWVNNWTLDPMALHWCRWSELPKTLAFVSSLYLYDYYYWKEERETSDLQQFWLYNARDSWNTLRVFLHQVSDNETYHIRNYQEQFRLVYPCLYCAFEGFAVDEEAKAAQRIEVEAARDKALANLRIMAADPEFNPGSSQQTARLLYDIIGASPVKGFGGTLSRSTDEKILKKVQLQHPILERVIREIWNYREQEKLITTYFNAVLRNGRLLYSITPFGTETGRMASKKSNWRLKYRDEKNKIKKTGFGAQVQNISPAAKKFLKADEGYVILEPDNNKSEARCVSKLSKCVPMQRALEDRTKDFYTSLGTLFFGIPYEMITKALRNLVLKRIVHGTNYMMQEDTFIDHVGVEQILKGAALLGAHINPNLEYNESKLHFQTLKQFAKFLLESYHKPFPEVRAWYKTIKTRISTTKRLTSVIGWTRYFFGDIDNVAAVLRSAVAHEPQNLSVSILNRGWYKLYKELVVTSNGEVRLKAQVHDSAPLQVLESKIDYYAPKIVACLESEIMVYGQPMRIPVDYHTGRTWYDAKG